MNYCVIIPARYKSTRLPGKPLIDLNGVPMIVRTYNQCAKVCSKELIYVATDDLRIKEICEKSDIQVILTSENCLTGTDRISECSEFLDYDIFINVQGDEPVFNPDDLTLMIENITNYPDEILNGFCEITDESQFNSRSTPKVVMDSQQKLLYMSRAPIPASKEGEFIKANRQVCVYAFPKKALMEFSKCNHKMPLESIEDIEILRFLELGWNVKMLKMSDLSQPVDNLEDVKKVEKLIVERNL